jgi:hypothetical protein
MGYESDVIGVHATLLCIKIHISERPDEGRFGSAALCNNWRRPCA